MNSLLLVRLCLMQIYIWIVFTHRARPANFFGIKNMSRYGYREILFFKGRISLKYHGQFMGKVSRLLVTKFRLISVAYKIKKTFSHSWRWYTIFNYYFMIESHLLVRIYLNILSTLIRYINQKINNYTPGWLRIKQTPSSVRSFKYKVLLK